MYDWGNVMFFFFFYYFFHFTASVITGFSRNTFWHSTRSCCEVGERQLFTKREKKGGGDKQAVTLTEDQTLLIGVHIFLAKCLCASKWNGTLTACLWEQANGVKVGVAVCVQTVVSLCNWNQALQLLHMILNFLRSRLCKYDRYA